MKIEMGKKYTTRDGRPVRILCVDGPTPWCVAGYIDGSISPACWNVDGRYSYVDARRASDLIEVRPEPTVEEIEWAINGFREAFNQHFWLGSGLPQYADKIADALHMVLVAKRTTEIVE